MLTLATRSSNSDQPGYWAEHISERNDYEIALLKDPGDDELSEAEMLLIQQIFAAYGHYDRFQLANELHEVLPEWKALESGREPISHKDILHAAGKSPQSIAMVERELESIAIVKAMFSPIDPRRS